MFITNGYICTNNFVSQRYFIFISFRGTSYHGWQLQPNSLTIQKVLDESLSVILGEKILTTGAGRTDSGVHAKYFAAHFDSRQPALTDNKNIISRLNKYLPPDISVLDLRKVNPDAHARFSAISRTYTYVISKVKDPFTREFSWYYRSRLDVAAMNRAASLLMSYNDFTSFARLHSDVRTNICTVSRAVWTEEENKIIFTISADRFLRNMVRAIVGTITDVGKGRISLAEFKQIIEEKNRSSAGKSAPASGLFLTGIEYPDNTFMV
jgi:tRNA pseudouridine38-40 synthase